MRWTAARPRPLCVRPTPCCPVIGAAGPVTANKYLQTNETRSSTFTVPLAVCRCGGRCAIGGRADRGAGSVEDVQAEVAAGLVDRVDRTRSLRIGLGLVLLFSVQLLIDAIIGPLLWLTLGLLWCTTSSLGLVMANATALAIEEAQGAAGTGSAILGALQAGVGAIVSPIVRVAGTATMVPMAIAMLGSAVIAAGATALTRPG
jgi:hypothetical protein